MTDENVLLLDGSVHLPNAHSAQQETDTAIDLRCPKLPSLLRLSSTHFSEGFCVFEFSKKWMPHRTICSIITVSYVCSAYVHHVVSGGDMLLARRCNKYSFQEISTLLRLITQGGNHFLNVGLLLTIVVFCLRWLTWGAVFLFTHKLSYLTRERTKSCPKTLLTSTELQIATVQNKRKHQVWLVWPFRVASTK